MVRVRKEAGLTSLLAKNPGMEVGFCVVGLEVVEGSVKRYNSREPIGEI